MTESKQVVMRKVGKSTLICAVDTPLSCLAVNPKDDVLAVAGRDVFQVFSIFSDKFVQISRGKTPSKACLPQTSTEKSQQLPSSPPSFTPGEAIIPSTSSIRSSTSATLALTCMQTNVNAPRSASVTDVAWSCAYSVLATGSTGGDIVLWDAAHNMTQISCFSGHNRSIHCIAYHPTSPYELISASQDGLLKMFDTRDPNPGISFRSFSHRGTAPSPVRDVNYSPKYTNVFAAAQENGIVSIWDTRQQARPFRAFQGHSCSIATLDWHPNWKGSGRNWLATAGAGDHMIRIWNFDQGAQSQSGHPQLVFTVHTSNVTRVRWRPGFPYQLVSSCNQTFDLNAYLWDIKRPHVPYASFEEHEGIVTSIAWSPRETDYFYTAGRDGLLVRHCIEDGLRPTETASPVALAVSCRGNMAHAVSRDRVLLQHGVPHSQLVTKAAEFIAGAGADAVVPEVVQPAGTTSLVRRSPFFRVIRSPGAPPRGATGVTSVVTPSKLNPDSTASAGSSSHSSSATRLQPVITIRDVSSLPPPGFYAAPTSPLRVDSAGTPVSRDNNTENLGVATSHPMLPPMGSVESANLFVSQAQGLLHCFEPSAKPADQFHWRITLLPSLVAALARSYKFSGPDFDQICTHNAIISLRYGQPFLTQFWCLLRSLYGRTPTPALLPPHSSDESVVTGSPDKSVATVAIAATELSTDQHHPSDSSGIGTLTVEVATTGQVSQTRPADDVGAVTSGVSLPRMLAALKITMPKLGDYDGSLLSLRHPANGNLEHDLGVGGTATATATVGGRGTGDGTGANIGLQYFSQKHSSDPMAPASYLDRTSRASIGVSNFADHTPSMSTKDSSGQSSSRHMSEVLYPTSGSLLTEAKLETMTTSRGQNLPPGLMRKEAEGPFGRKLVGAGATFSRVQRNRRSGVNPAPLERGSANVAHPGDTTRDSRQFSVPLAASVKVVAAPTTPMVVRSDEAEDIFRCMETDSGRAAVVTPVIGHATANVRPADGQQLESAVAHADHRSDVAATMTTRHMTDEAFLSGRLSVPADVGGGTRRPGTPGFGSRGKPSRHQQQASTAETAGHSSSRLVKVKGHISAMATTGSSHRHHHASVRSNTTGRQKIQHASSLHEHSREVGGTPDQDEVQLLAQFAPKALTAVFHEAPLVGCSAFPVDTNPLADVSHLVARWFCELVDSGNVQTVCTALLALSGKVNFSDLIGVTRIEAWFLAYLNVLSRFRLWNVSALIIRQCGQGKPDSLVPTAGRPSLSATPGTVTTQEPSRRPGEVAQATPGCKGPMFVLQSPSPPPPQEEIAGSVTVAQQQVQAQCIAPSVAGLSQMSTSLMIHCGKCSKPLAASEATKALTGHAGWACARHTTTAVMGGDPANVRCAICHLTVRGLFAWCRGCSHGGHLEHMQAWLSRSKECPAGCGHECEYG